jgi:hypothetical protein
MANKHSLLAALKNITDFSDPDAVQRKISPRKWTRFNNMTRDQYDDLVQRDTRVIISTPRASNAGNPDRTFPMKSYPWDYCMADHNLGLYWFIEPEFYKEGDLPPC